MIHHHHSSLLSSIIIHYHPSIILHHRNLSSIIIHPSRSIFTIILILIIMHNHHHHHHHQLHHLHHLHSPPPPPENPLQFTLYCWQYYVLLATLTLIMFYWKNKIQNWRFQVSYFVRLWWCCDVILRCDVIMTQICQQYKVIAIKDRVDCTYYHIYILLHGYCIYYMI